MSDSGEAFALYALPKVSITTAPMATVMKKTFVKEDVVLVIKFID